MLNTVQRVSALLIGLQRLFAGLLQDCLAGLQSCLVLFLLLSVPIGASGQYIEFTAFVTHPSEGPYNQDLHVRLQIIRKDFQAATEEDAETVVWEKTYSPVTVYNGTMSLLLDESDNGEPIDATVFESSVDYEFEPESFPNRVSRDLLPDGSYAIRLFMRRSLGAEEERIRPDFNFDGSPFSVSSIPLSGDSVKSGRLSIQSFPEAGSLGQALIQVDPFTGSLASPRHGLYIEDGSLEVETSDPSQDSIHVEGAFFLKNARVNTGTVNVSDGEVRLKTLCMSKDCSAADPVFDSPLFSYGSFELREFIDRDTPEEVDDFYGIVPAGQSRIAALKINRQDQSLEPLVALTGSSEFNLLDQASMVLRGAEARVSVQQGEMRVEVPKALTQPGHDRLFRINALRELGSSTEEREDFRRENFHKISADRFYSSAEAEDGTILPGGYSFKPSGNSNAMAIQFKFEDHGEALERINDRIRERFPGNDSRLLQVIFDPILTGEIITQMLQGDQGNSLNFFDLHQHDIIGQATAIQILEIINDPRFNDGATINAAKVSEDLIKEITTDQRWLGQATFEDNDNEDSLFVKGNLNLLYDSYPIVFGGNGLEDKPFLGAVTPLTGNPREVWFQNDDSGAADQWMNLTMQDLTIYDRLLIQGRDGLPRNLTAYGEFNLSGPFEVLQDFDVQGRLLTGCNDAICLNTTGLNRPSLITVRQAQGITNISAGVFRTALSEFYSTPSTNSRFLNLRLNRLELTGAGQPVALQGGLHSSGLLDIASDAVVSGSPTTNLVQADRFLSADPDFFSDPRNTSYWNSVAISGALDITGQVSVEGSIDISGSIQASSADVSGDSRIASTVYADRFVDTNGDPNSLGREMLLNPDSISRLNDLTADSGILLSGDTGINGDLDAGTTITVSGRVEQPALLTANRLTDSDDTAYFMDPSGFSRLHQLRVESFLQTSILTLTNPQIGADLTVSDSASLDLSGTFHGPMRSTSGVLQLSDTQQRLFEVDQDGVIYANSAEIAGDSGINRGEISGSITVGRTATFEPPTYFSNSKLSILDSFAMQNPATETTVLMNSAGDISLASSARLTGSVVFSDSSARGIIPATRWEVASQSPAAHWLTARRADSIALDLQARRAMVSQTGTHAHPFEVTDSITLSRFLDFEDSHYTVWPAETSVLRQLAVLSSEIVTVPVSNVSASWLADGHRPSYVFNPSDLSRLQDLQVEQKLQLFSNLSVLPTNGTTGSFLSRVLLGATTSTTQVALQAGNALSIDRSADTTIRLNYNKTGDLILRDSILSLGNGSSQTAVGQTTMSTLVVLPPQTYNPEDASNQPAWYADHLHQHDTFDDVHYTQIARRDIANQFVDRVRFTANSDAVLLQPQSVTSATWSSHTTSFDERQQAQAFTVDSRILLAEGISPSQTRPDTLLQWQASSSGPLTTAQNSHWTKPNGAFTASSQRIYAAGGREGNAPSNEAVSFNVTDQTFATPSLPLALSAAEAAHVGGNTYLFGGFFNSGAGLKPFDGSLRWEPDNTIQNLGTTAALPKAWQGSGRTLVVSGTEILADNSAGNFQKALDFGQSMHSLHVATDGYNLCLSTPSQVTDLYHLPSGIHLNNGSPLNDAIECQIDPHQEQKVLFLRTSGGSSGELYSANFDGSGASAVSGAQGIEARSLKVEDDARLAMTGKTNLSTLGERNGLITANGNLHTADSGPNASLSGVQSGLNALDLEIEADRFIFSSESLSHNSQRNLHALNFAGDRLRQLSHLPQGIWNRPSVLDSGEAIVATSAATSIQNHLPFALNTGCVLSRGERAWIFGANGNRILVYDSRTDTYSALGETLDLGPGLECTWDQSNHVYLRSGAEFAVYEFDRGRVRPLPAVPFSTPGALAANADSVWTLLDTTSAADSVFLRFDRTTQGWNSETSPGRYNNATMAVFDNSLFVHGSSDSTAPRKQVIGSGTWTALTTLPTSTQVTFTDLHSATFFSDGSDLYLAGGEDGSQSSSEIYKLNNAQDGFDILSGFDTPVHSAGVYTHAGYAYALGGHPDPQTLRIAPLTASSDYYQVYHQDFVSLKKTALQTVTDFAQACNPSHTSTTWFLNADRDILSLDHDNANLSVIRDATQPITHLACSAHWIWYSRQNASGGTVIERVSLDGSDIQSDIQTLIEGPTLSANPSDDFKVLSVNPSETALYFGLDDGTAPVDRVYRARLNPNLDPVLVHNSSILALDYKGPATVTEERSGVLFIAQSSDFSDLSTVVLENLSLRDALPAKDGGTWILGVDASRNQNIFYLSEDRSTYFQLTEHQRPDKATQLIGELGHRPLYTAQISGVSTLLQDSESGYDILTETQTAFHGPVYEPLRRRNATFTYKNRIYYRIGSQLYRSQNLSSAGDPVFHLHDTQPALAEGTWQVTQESNRIFLYNETNHSIFSYHPESRSLLPITEAPVNSEATLASLNDNLYLFESGGIQKIQTFENKTSQNSVVAYSASQSNPESTPQQVFGLRPDGRASARQFKGRANLEDNSLPGGVGDLGIADGSLGSADLATEAITRSKIRDLSIGSRHIQSAAISGSNFQTNSLSSESFADEVLADSKILDRSLGQETLQASSLSSELIASQTLISQDFARGGVLSENIRQEGISGAVIEDSAIASSILSENTLVLEDFDSAAISTKQIEDASIQDIDIATHSVSERVFSTSSIENRSLELSSVTSRTIARNTLDSSRVLNDSIATIDIQTASISADLFVSNAIDSSHIANDDEGIQTENIRDVAVTLSRFTSRSLGQSKVDTDAINEVDIEDQTLDQRVFAPQSFDSPNLVDSSIENSSLGSSAIRIEKLANLSIDTVDVADEAIVNRHFSTGGSGATTELATALLMNQSAAFGTYENDLFLLRASPSSSYRIDLGNYTRTPLAANLPSTISAHAQSPQTLFILLTSGRLFGFDFNQEILHEHTQYTGTTSIQANQSGFHQASNIVFVGSDAAQDAALTYSLSTESWSETAMGESIEGSVPAEYSGTQYFFSYSAPNSILVTTTNGSSYASTTLSTDFNFTGSQAVTYESYIYVFGGQGKANAIHRYHPADNSITALNDIPLNVDFTAAVSDHVAFWQGRFYLSHLQSTQALQLWHPNLDASISSRNLKPNSVSTANIQSNSLKTINFAHDSIGTNHIQNFSLIGLDIETSVLWSRSVRNQSIRSEHLESESITTAKIASDAINSRVIVNQSLLDEDFDQLSIDQRTLAPDSIANSEVLSLTIESSRLGGESVTAQKIDTAAVLGTDIQDAQITTPDIQDQTIQGDDLAHAQIRSRHILDDNILDIHLNALAITRDKIETHTLLEDVIADAAIGSTTQILNLSVVDSHFQTHTIPSGAFSSLQPDRLMTSRLASASLSAIDFATQTLQETDFADLGIEENLIEPNSLGDRAFSPDSVLRQHIASASLTDSAFDSRIVTVGNFQDYSLIDEDFATDSVYGIHLLSFTLDSTSFATDAVGSAIGADSLTSTRFESYSLQDEDIDDLQLGSSQVASSQIQSTHVENRTLLQSSFENEAINARKLQPFGLLNEDFQTSSIAPSMLASNSIEGNRIDTGTLAGNRFNTASLTGRDFANETISTAKIADDSIHSSAIGQYQIETDSIAAGSITSQALVDDAVSVSDQLESTDVFDSANFLDRSIRGTSIVSYTLTHPQLANAAIRQDLMQADVIGPLEEQPPPSQTPYRATTQSVNPTQLRKVEALGEDLWFAAAVADSVLLQSSDGINYSPSGISCPSGETLHSFSLLNQQSGYLGCSNSVYFFPDLSTPAVAVSTLSTTGEFIQDLIFFNHEQGLAMSGGSSDASPSHVFKTANGGQSWQPTGIAHAYLTPFSRYENQIVFGRTAPTYGAEAGPGTIYYSDDAGSSISAQDLNPTSNVLDVAFDPQNGRILSLISDLTGNHPHSLFEFEPGSGALTVISNPLPPTSGGGNVNPWSALAFSGRKVLILDNNPSSTLFGGFLVDQDTGEFDQITPLLTGPIAHELPQTSNLLRPVSLKDGSVLISTRAGDTVHWRAKRYKHIVDESLESASVAVASIATHHLRQASVAGDRFQTSAISQTHLQASGLSQGPPVASLKNAAADLSRLHSNHDGSLVIGLNAPGNEVRVSTDGGETFTNVSGYPIGDTYSDCHARGEGVICGPAAGGSTILVSRDRGSSFSAITTTPFDAQNVAVYAFDSSNFLAVGVSGNDFFPASYEPDTESFIRLRTSAGGDVTIDSCTNPAPRDMHFFNGEDGLLVMSCSSPANTAFQTTDGGYSWSPISIGLNHNSRMAALSRDHIWLSKEKELYSSVFSEAPVLLTDFSSKIQSMRFLSANIGFVSLGGSDDRVLYTSNGGSSFTTLTAVHSGVKSLAYLSNGIVGGVTDDNTYYQFQLRDPHQPFGSLASEAFDIGTSVTADQIAGNSFDGNLLQDDALGASSIANRSISREKVANAAADRSSIQTRGLKSQSFAYQSLLSGKLATDAIRSSLLKSKILTSGHILDGSITSRELASGVLLGGALGEAPITTEKIKAADITGRVLQNSVLGTEHVVPQTLKGENFEDSSLSGARFQEHVIENMHLEAPFNLESRKIKRYALDETAFSPATLNSRTLGDESLWTAQFQMGSIGESKLAADSIGTEALAYKGIVQSVLQPSIVTSSRVDQQTLRGEHFQGSEIHRDRFAALAGAISHAKLAKATFTASELATASIIQNKFSTTSSLTLTRSRFASGAVSSDAISGNVFNQSFFATGAFRGAQLSENIVDSSHIAANSILQRHIQPSSLLGVDLADNAIELRHLNADEDFFLRMDNGAIGEAQFRATTLIASNFLNNGLQASSFADNALFANQFNATQPVSVLASEALTEMAFELRTLPADAFADSSLQGTHFQDNSLHSRVFANDFLQAAQTTGMNIEAQYVASSTLTEADFDPATDLTGDRLLDASFDGSEFQDGFLGDADFTVNTIPTAKLADDSFGTREIEDNALTAADIEDDTFTDDDAFSDLTHADVADNTIENADVSPGGISSRAVLDESLDGSDVADGQIGSDRFDTASLHEASLHNDFVSNRLAAAVITHAKLSTTDPIDASSIQDDAIGGPEILPDSLPADRFQNLDASATFQGGSLSANHLQNEALDGTALDNSLNSANLADATIEIGLFSNGFQSSHIGAGQITKAKLQANTVDPSRLGNSAVITSKIENSSLIADNFQNESMPGTRIGNQELNSAKFETFDVPDAKIGTDLDWSTLADEALSTEHFDNEMLDTTHIQNSQIQLSNVTSGVTALEIDNSLTSASLSGTVGGDRIQDGAITADQIGSPIQNNRFDSLLEARSLLADTVTTNRIDFSSGDFTQSQLRADSVTAIHFPDSEIDPNTKFGPGQLSATNLLPLTYGDLERNSLNITSGQAAKFHNLTRDDFDAALELSSAEIATDALNTGDMGDGLITKSHILDSETEKQQLLDTGGTDAETHADALHYHQVQALGSGASCPTGFDPLNGQQMCILHTGKSFATAVKATEQCSKAEAHVCSLRELEAACDEQGQAKFSGRYAIAEYTTKGILSAKKSGPNCRFNNALDHLPFSAGGGSSSKVVCCINN